MPLSSHDRIRGGHQSRTDPPGGRSADRSRIVRAPARTYAPCADATWGVGSSSPRLRTKKIATPHCPLDEAPGNEPSNDEGSYRGPHGYRMRLQPAEHTEAQNLKQSEQQAHRG